MDRTLHPWTSTEPTLRRTGSIFFLVGCGWWAAAVRTAATYGTIGELRNGADRLARMPAWRSPDLEALLGGPLDATGLTENGLRRLIAAGTTEGEQLEFKQDTYGTSPKQKRGWTPAQEFCKDVAALANHRGGLLILGVEESPDGVALALTPLVDTTAEREDQWLHAVALNHLSPPVDMSIIPVPVEAGGFCLAIVVPPGIRAPHAVLGDAGEPRKALRYPRRDGRDTAWLPEPEVAERYRRRFEAHAGLRARRETVLTDGRTALSQSDARWTFTAVIPDASVYGRLDQAAVTAITEWAHNNIDGSPLGSHLDFSGRSMAGPGRVTFTQAITGATNRTLHWPTGATRRSTSTAQRSSPPSMPAGRSDSAVITWSTNWC